MAPFRVLILEDDAILSLDLQTIVQCWTDAKVTSCSSVKQAAKAQTALTGGFDLALLDIEVADGTSYAFAQTLREKQTPFAFVSGSDSGAPDFPEALRDAPFIMKPYSRRAIESVIAKAAGARRHP